MASSAMTDGAVEAVILYRRAAKRHRREALIFETRNMPLTARKERVTAERITRAIKAELDNPDD